MRITARDVPTRLATGAYVLHSGIEKWRRDDDRARALHGIAAKAFPFLDRIDPPTFLKALALTEITTGSLLLMPFVPNRVAGAPLTAFSAGLLTMYLRTPSMHKQGSPWPTPAGIGVSKDVWMLAIGLNLLADGSGSDPDPGPKVRNARWIVRYGTGWRS